MIRTILISSVATFALAACDQKPTSTAEQQSQDRQAAELQAQTPPNAIDRTAAAVGNEVEQAANLNADITAAELASGLRVGDVPNPATSLATASVKLKNGQTIGEVRSVVVGTNGMATAVVVEVGGFLNVGERAVSIDASKLTFLTARNTLVAAVSKYDLEQMPTAPK